MKPTKAESAHFSLSGDFGAPDEAQQGSADTLAYLADLLAELRDMADAGGHKTLSGLIGLAHSEALSCRSCDRG